MQIPAKDESGWVPQIIEGTISHGTLRPQDLLRSFSSELERLHPFRNSDLIAEARDAANALDSGDYEEMVSNHSWPPHPGDWPDCASQVLAELSDKIEELLPESYYFGTAEGDGADFGIWRLQEDEPCPDCGGTGIAEWHGPGVPPSDCQTCNRED